MVDAKSLPESQHLERGEHKMKRSRRAATAVSLAELANTTQIGGDLSGRSSTASPSSTGSCLRPGPAATSRSTLPLPELRAQLWLDRSIAFIAMVPLLYLTYYRYQHMRLGIPLASFAIGTSITFVTMILRRSPKRVTPNPLYWLLTFVATYWALLTLGVMQKGRPVVPSAVSDAVALCGLAVIVWARLSLGRNIGFVPAQREIVTTGAYRYMRHPIYTGLFLGLLGIALRAYSPRNVAILGLGMAWLLIKSIVEENFLRVDPQYAAYLERVRARWIPFLA
jgi:protein-S-isoprenylcysteine O-methyltransferase Ste14